jgi:hypothetical protein
MLLPDKQAVRSVLIGATICGATAVFLCGLLLSRLYLPGLLGEWFSLMVGVLTSPFIMEFSLVILGFVLILGINTWRRHREGDEFRYLEQVAQPAGLPDHAQWAIYQDQPLAAPEMGTLDFAEGALAAGDFQELARLLSDLDQMELNQPDVIRLRIGLAEGTGKADLAAALREKLR